MLPIKRILAPTDFSTRSYPALDVAAELATQFRAELLVIHVLTPVPVAVPGAAGQMPVNLDIYRDSMAKDAESALADLITDRVPDGVDCRSEVRWGNPAETIVEAADEARSDLIVLCTRGATGLSRWVSGSVTEKVVRLSNVPVLTVQAEHHD